MCGCWSRAASSTSRLNRSTDAPASSSGARTLMTTRRLSAGSVATYVMDMPPPPSSRSITYWPAIEASRRLRKSDMSTGWGLDRGTTVEYASTPGRGQGRRRAPCSGRGDLTVVARRATLAAARRAASTTSTGSDPACTGRRLAQRGRRAGLARSSTSSTSRRACRGAAARPSRRDAWGARRPSFRTSPGG